MTHIGFTGTHHGMTVQQSDTLRTLLYGYEVFTLHHGGCLGADTEAHQAARVTQRCCGVIVHPCNIEAMQGACRYRPCDIKLAPKPPLHRNMDIVDAVEFMIAAPKQDYMITRSGTWATVRYAQQQGKLIHIILPNGMTVGD